MDRPDPFARWGNLHRLAPWLVPAVFVLVLWALQHALAEVHLRDVMHAIARLPAWRIAGAIVATAASYLLLTGYDALALRYIGRPLSYPRTALASFTGYVLNMNLGLSVLGSATARYRLYSFWGLGAVDIARIVGFCALTTGLGLMATGGATLALGNLPAVAATWMPPAAARVLGALSIALVLGYVVLCARRRKPVRIRAWSIEVPRGRIASLQVALGAADLLAAGTVLYVLFPAGDVGFASFLGVYLSAVVAGLVSHIPGGLGVFEGVMLVALPTQVPTETLLATLVAFRAIYYLMPLGTGILLLGAFEALRHRARVARWADGAIRSVSAVAPRALALATFLGGVILLLSGATPAEHDRLRWLRGLLPLPVIELSHFLGSVAGMCLLFVARGLQRRLNAAWYIAASLLIAGIAFSLAKGFDWEEALILAGMLGGLMVSRREFYRRSSLLDQQFTPGWTIAIVLGTAGSVWLGFFAYKHVEYSHDLWWHFSARGDAPRFLRATAGAAVAAVALALAHLLRHPRVRPHLPDADEQRAAAQVAAESRESRAWLALVGDKALLFSPSRRALLMYGIAGRSWVALGDPLGDEAEGRELVWRFREDCDRQGGWTVFYEVGPATLPLYVDLGLALFKLGEEARVPLRGWTLEGRARRGLRATHARLEREGCSFALWDAEQVQSRLPELRAISDDWLACKHAREKGFSLGRFDAAYLSHLPVAVVLRGGRPVAFANVWMSGACEELSVDLMRYGPDAPPSTMEYLFVELLLFGAERGYAWFNLGMAPLAGIEAHPLAPWWNRVGAAIFRHGEHFYNFSGLRQYKEKFDPVWQPRYLACPGGLVLPRVLTSVAALISGGVIGVLRR